MKAKEVRDRALFVRIKGQNETWLKLEMRKLRYKSKGEFVDALLDEVREKNDRNTRKLRRVG
jgi:hypothetical protein